MIDREIARQIAARVIREGEAGYQPALVIIDRHTEETEDVFIFRTQSEKSVRTGNPGFRLMGGGPIVVDKREGFAFHYGSKPLNWSEDFMSWRSRLRIVSLDEVVEELTTAGKGNGGILVADWPNSLPKIYSVFNIYGKIRYRNEHGTNSRGPGSFSRLRYARL
ncbi:MAG TPA: YrhB domain-containing protein [Thermoplasmata archaeon]|nr:YrhB domain-containing protein [Thermoplasmata archaeon]